MDVTIDGVRYVPVVHDEVVLTVLVPSVSTRRATFAPKIADALFGQHERLTPADRKRVEILILTDAKGMLVGDKRNAMVRMARGTYVVFVDDDDRIADDYISTLLDATGAGADCITFDAAVSVNGALPKTCKYSLKYERDHNAADHYQRVPNHITAVKRILMLAVPFPSKQSGEDSEYAARLRPSLKTEKRIERVLYWYDANDATTETQGPRNAVTTPSAITVDLVILSKALTPVLQAMCQKAVDTAIAGADHYKINVIVVEQQPGIIYSGAMTTHKPGEFNYNRFANEAVRCGTADWIMIANSDLVFDPGWLHALLQAGVDLVSPIDPMHRSQRNIKHDEAGWQNGHHFSGWCFMLRRELWDKIGGFDECVSYWCSDDVVIEQCRKVGKMPRAVYGARVRHLGSQTLKTPSDDQAWGQVRIFNAKYGKKVFGNDPRYLAYLRKNGIAA